MIHYNDKYFGIEKELRQEYMVETTLATTNETFFLVMETEAIAAVL